MAHVPRMSHEGWPGWAKLVFILGALAMVILGIISILGSKHTGGAVLGIISAVVGALYLIGLFFSPRWLKDPSSTL